jgi:hypothetical protein
MIGNNTDDVVIPQPMRKKRHNDTPGVELAIHERPPSKGFLRTYLRDKFDTGVGTDGWAA